MIIRNISKEKIIIDGKLVYPKQQIKVDDDFDLNKFKDKVENITVYNVNFNKSLNKKENKLMKKNIVETASIKSTINSMDIKDNFLSDFDILKNNYLDICKEKNIDKKIIDKIKETNSKENLIYVIINYVLPMLN